MQQPPLLKLGRAHLRLATHQLRSLCLAPLQDSASDSSQSPWLIVGLGNPGTKFEGTRHNVGFELINAISEAEGIALSASEHQALVGRGTIGGAPVILAKPQTYANLSGESVYDDMDSDVGVTKLLARGKPGGHIGVRSLIKHLEGSRDFPRFRIGIGRPPGKMDSHAYLLQLFSNDERKLIDIVIPFGVDAMRLVATEGIERAACIWNETWKARFRKKKISLLNQS
eukprot:c26478_g1_i4 orf=57-737(+)